MNHGNAFIWNGANPSRSKHPFGQLERLLRKRMDLCPHPYRVRSQVHGFSHGLKNVHRTLFTPVCALVPPFRIHPHPLPTKNTTQTGGVFCWQRMRDSNPRERSQSPVCYRYTNPLYSESTGTISVTERQPYGYRRVSNELSAATRRLVETTGLEPVTSCV